ncbi:MAG: hypothetical protein ACEQSN_16910, partial [Yersinia sp. (in: enterobacteria)]
MSLIIGSPYGPAQALFKMVYNQFVAPLPPSCNLNYFWELENILVLDVGRYGFVKLQYYTPEYGFNDVITYTDSESMFEDLWQEWLDTRLYLFAKGTPMLEMGYEEIFKCLPE